MLKQLLLATLALLPALANAASLTEMETRWLKAGAPVLAYAQRLNLPIDIIVQPKARPGDVPLAMGFVDGRCKLVLSMRDNPDAEDILASVPEQQRGLMIEAMTAHEIGHCWRYVRGVWHALPAGFVDTGVVPGADEELLAQVKAMRDMRREEGYADLVALAWVKRQNPAEYARVHAWMDGLRAKVPVSGSGHDTRIWVGLARDASMFVHSANPFEDAGPLWRQGLLLDE